MQQRPLPHAEQSELNRAPPLAAAGQAARLQAIVSFDRTAGRLLTYPAPLQLPQRGDTARESSNTRRSAGTMSVLWRGANVLSDHCILKKSIELSSASMNASTSASVL
eukprot:364731-Chlamydomonas_euryale.AAC.7